MGIVIVVDASSGEDGAVNATQEAAVSQVQSPNDIRTHRLLLMVFAPVDIGSSSTASAVQYMGWTNLLQLRLDGLSVLHTNRCRINFVALALQDLLKMAGNPALASPDEKSMRHGENLMDTKDRS